MKIGGKREIGKYERNMQGDVTRMLRKWKNMVILHTIVHRKIFPSIKCGNTPASPHPRQPSLVNKQASRFGNEAYFFPQAYTLTLQQFLEAVQ